MQRSNRIIRRVMIENKIEEEDENVYEGGVILPNLERGHYSLI